MTVKKLVYWTLTALLPLSLLLSGCSDEPEERRVQRYVPQQQVEVVRYYQEEDDEGGLAEILDEMGDFREDTAKLKDAEARKIREKRKIIEAKNEQLRLQAAQVPVTSVAQKGPGAAVVGGAVVGAAVVDGVTVNTVNPRLTSPEEKITPPLAM